MTWAGLIAVWATVAALAVTLLVAEFWPREK